MKLKQISKTPHMLWQFFMDNNHSRPSQPHAFPIRFLLGQRWTRFTEYPGFRLPITHLILILPGVLHSDWMIKVRLEEIGHNCFDKNFTCILLQTEPLGRREYARAVLHVVLAGPVDEGVEGPQRHVWEVPGRSRPLHAKFRGQRYLKTVQSSASKVPAYSFQW